MSLRKSDNLRFKTLGLSVVGVKLLISHYILMNTF